MRFQTVRREVWTPRGIAEVFAFFSDAGNLAEITPPWLGFRMRTPEPIHMAPGAQIRYRLNVRGIPIFWTTEIREWSPPRGFIDVQLKGPYALWHHTHRFDAVNGGTRMRDVVRYLLPFGPFGRLVNALQVRRDVSQIFDYGEKRIRELFGSAPAPR